MTQSTSKSFHSLTSHLSLRCYSHLFFFFLFFLACFFYLLLVLRWENCSIQCPLERQKYNFILCADCLFFEDSRVALVDSICHFLSSNGTALVMAPKRGKSMNSFVKKCTAKGLSCKILTYYNKEIWERHQKFLASTYYNEDIHYPILIKISYSK